MKTKFFSIIFLSLLLATVSCKNVYLYGKSSSFPHDTTPSMVFFDDQVMSLSPKTYPSDRWIYVEYTTKTGAFVKGRLLEVTDSDLVISRGYYNDKVDESIIYEDAYNVAKNEVMLLKVWGNK